MARHSIRQTLGMKIAAGALILAVIIITLTVLKVPRKPGQQTNLEQTEQEAGGRPRIGGNVEKLPAPGNPGTMRPMYPLDEGAYYPVPAASSPQLPGQINPTDSDRLPPVTTEGEVGRLEAPPTRIHSLAEAGTIMGVDPGRAADVGVTHTHVLPPEALPVVHKTDAASVSAPLGSAASVIGAPPGVPADEVGRTKTAPLPKDRKPPE